jgi:hypothetical protein
LFAYPSTSHQLRSPASRAWQVNAFIVLWLQGISPIKGHIFTPTKHPVVLKERGRYLPTNSLPHDTQCDLIATQGQGSHSLRETKKCSMLLRRIPPSLLVTSSLVKFMIV